MEKCAVLLVVILVCAVVSLPVENSEIDSVPQTQTQDQAHIISKRFINPMFSLGADETGLIVKMRTKRSYDECEKLQLCRLHARSQHSFLAAFELYFVNKENAQQWDHRTRSRAECEERFGDCYDKK